MGSLFLMPESKAETPSAWRTLSQILPPRDEDQDFWWQLTGLHMAHALHEAGYPLPTQYETLLFHHHWVVPYLGPRPGPDGPALWTSMTAVDGSPIEYSWKWNAADGVGHPCVRYAMEPISRASGTAADPLNQVAARDMFRRLATQIPTINLEWTEHFMATFFDPDTSKYVLQAQERGPFTTTYMMGIEVREQAFRFKLYFLPPSMSPSLWRITLAQLQPHNPARDIVHDFLDTSPEGPKMIPMCLAVDAVDPAKARQKLYFMTERRSLASVYEILTMGGRGPLSPSQRADLRSLICAVTGVPEDFPDDQDVPHTGSQTTFEGFRIDTPDGAFHINQFDYCYYVDMAPHRALPSVKVNIPTRVIGPNDLDLARNLVAWLRKRGRGAFGDNYLRMLTAVASHRRLQDSKEMHTYIGMMFNEEGELDITSYIAAEVYHPQRMKGLRTDAVA